MKRKHLGATLFALTAGLSAHTAIAGSHRYELSPAYRDECGACHVAYPPALLSAASWRALMSGLDRHFGSDASLDTAKARDIGNWLADNAGRRDSTDARGRPLLRISETPWFRKEHREGHDGLTAAVWRSPAVGAASNCVACHRRAEQGDFNEGSLQLPR
jgi:hypothetical protein